MSLVLLLSAFSLALADTAPSLRCAGTSQVLPAAKTTVSTEGTQSAVVIFANFADANAASPPSWSSSIFDEALPGSFSHFYDTMSFGRIAVLGEVAPKSYASTSPSSAYLSEDPTERGQFGRFSLEVLRAADVDIDFGRFDNDGQDGLPNSGDDDGFVDVVFIIVPSMPANFILGPSTGFGELGWIVDYRTNDNAASGRPIRITNRQGTIQQGRNFHEAVGTMCHEFGHVLGLPDLFNIEYLGDRNVGPEHDSAGIGFWGLMGWGALGWNGNDGPTSFSAWSRATLGWTRVRDVQHVKEAVVLSPIGGGGPVLRVPLMNREHFLLEYRNKEAYYDRNIPASGLLVWHVLEGPGHPVLDLECADGKWLDAGFPGGQSPDNISGQDNLDFWSHNTTYTARHHGNRGDATDPFDGANYRAFTPETNPSSHSLDRSLSASLDNIRVADTGVTLEILAPESVVEIDTLFVADENDDKLYLSGEELRLGFSFRHSQGIAPKDLELRLSSDTPHVEWVVDRMQLGALGVDEFAETPVTESGTPRLRFSTGFVGFHTASITAEIVANGRVTDTKTLVLTGISSRQSIKGVVVEEVEGNSDGLVQPGEIIRLYLTLDAAAQNRAVRFTSSLRALDRPVTNMDGPGVWFELADSVARTVRSPRFVIPAEHPDTTVSFGFGVHTEFASWEDTIWVPLVAGADQTPPAVGNMRISSQAASVHFEIPLEQILEGGRVRSSLVEILNADSVLVASVPLSRGIDRYEGSWQAPGLGLYLFRTVVSDNSENIGFSRYHKHTVLKPTPVPRNDTGKWRFVATHEREFPPGYQDLVSAPTNPSLMYLATEFGYWRSADAGASWDRLGRMKRGIVPLFVDANDPYTLYSADGLWSADAGNTWLDLEIPETLTIRHVDPRHSGWLYAIREGPLTGRTLALSKDGGKSWHMNSVRETLPVRTHAGLEHVIYFGGTRIFNLTTFEWVPSKLNFSTDEGETWSYNQMDRILTHVDADPASATGLYAMAQDTLLFSDDRGENWHFLFLFPAPRAGIVDSYGLQIHPTEPRNLAAWNVFHRPRFLFLSQDAGLSWQRTEFAPSSDSGGKFLLHPRDPTRLYRVSDEVFAQSIDFGQTWNEVTVPQTGAPVSLIGVMSNRVMLAGGRRIGHDGRIVAGLLESNDGGSHWRRVESAQELSSFPFSQVELLVPDPVEPSHLMAYTNIYEFKRSEDGGNTWLGMSIPGFGVRFAAWRAYQPHPVIAPDLRTPGAYFIVDAGGVRYSEDFGATWELREEGLPSVSHDRLDDSGPHSFALDPLVDGGAYAAFGDTLWSTLDAGKNWELHAHTGFGSEIRLLGINPEAPERMYAATRYGLSTSDDRGENWTQRLQFSSRASVRIRLRFTPGDSSRIYLVTGPHLYETLDAGDTWTSIGDDLVNRASFNDVAVSPQDPAVVIAATSWGLFKTRRPFDTSVSAGHNGKPHQFALKQNFPNPFNSGTTIRFSVSGQQRTSLNVYSVVGQKIRTLIDNKLEGGSHSATWDGRDEDGKLVGSGLYFCRLSTGKEVATIKLLNLR